MIDSTSRIKKLHITIHSPDKMALVSWVRWVVSRRSLGNSKLGADKPFCGDDRVMFLKEQF